MGLGVLNRHIINKSSYGKLFAKTNSTSSNWRIPLMTGDVFTYTIVDNVNNYIIREGIMQGGQQSIYADLSASSGDVSIFVDVDNNGNNLSSISSYYNIAKLTYIDFNVFPKLKVFLLYNGINDLIEVGGSDLLNLETFEIYSSSNWKGLDFSNTTKLKNFKIFIRNFQTDILIDISNNTDLENYTNYTLNPSFNLSNHLKLKELQYRNNDTTLDVRIDNGFLPLLRTFNEVDTNPSKVYDFTINDFSLIETAFLSLSDNIIGRNTLTNLNYLNVIARNLATIDFTGIPNLDKLKLGIWDNYTDNIIDTIIIDNLPISSLESYRNKLVGVLDLTTLTNLTKFLTSYQNLLTDIIIDNGLNNQITQFETKYDTHIIDVKVDNPTDANNGNPPYSPTIWKEYLNFGSWNFI